MWKWLRLCLILSSIFALTACLGGAEEDDGSDDTTEGYSIGGTIAGLSGTALLKLNNKSALYFDKDGKFEFALKIDSGVAYEVTIAAPTGQICTVVNGSGTATNNVSDVAVVCAATSKSVGGTISGLTGTVVLQTSAGEKKSVAANGAYTFSQEFAKGSTYAVSVFADPFGQTCTVANPSGTIAAVNVTNVNVTCVTIPTYSIGGSVSGLTGTLIVKNNGKDPLTVNANGSFTFATEINSSTVYSVTIATQPTGQTCVLSSASGTAIADVTTVGVVCTTNQYNIGGTVSGLSGTLVLQNNGGDDKSVTTNGTFKFTTKLTHGTTYAATILTQPTGHTCVLTNGTGTATTNVTTISVVCTKIKYSVSGTVTGLSGGSLVLKNNNTNATTVNADGPFSFSTTIAYGSVYKVTVSSKPSTQICNVANGQATMGAANVTNVTVTCAAIPSYTVGGTVTGLTGTLVLRNNGGDNLTINADGNFEFATEIQAASAYAATVFTQPTGQTCTITNGSGTVLTSAVTDIEVACTTKTYTIGGTVTGLSSGSFVLQNSGGDDETVSANGSYTFATQVDHGTAYTVAISEEATGFTCVVSNGTGTATANVTNVNVACSVATYEIGGTVSGLNGGTLTIKNNGGNSTAISSDGAYTFSTKVQHAGAYAVTVSSNPSGQHCTVSNGSGSVNGADVTDVDIACADPSWKTPADASDNISVDGEDASGRARVVTDEDGNEIIAWLQSDGSSVQLFKSEFRNGVWSHPSSITDNISPNVEDVLDFDLAMDDNGNAIIVWTQSNGTNVRVYKSEYRSGAWTHPSSLSSTVDSNAYNASSPRVAMGNNSRAVIVWSQLSASVPRVYKREYISSSWNTAVDVASGIAAGGVKPRVAMNDSGHTVIAFTDGTNVFAAEYRGSSWALPSSGDALSANTTSTAAGAFLDVGIDNSGETLVGWTQDDGGGTEQLFMAEYRSSTWTIPADANAALSFVSAGPQTVTGADLAVSAGGDAIIVWSQAWSGGEVFAAEYRSGSWSLPGDNTSVFGIATGSAVSPAAAMNAAGDSVVTWLQNDGSNMAVLKATYSGGSWTHPGDATENLSVDGQSVTSLPDAAVGVDQAGIVWIDSDGANQQVFSSQYW
ncbi:MAG TPA: hypothetical protein VM432_00230 [Bdellovibrionales bacterium]|nr:hypothetical protein [Bdellovibrionales bacterium]